jgi:Permuted papain-like amidase enzyme, YaeF/YiiX, C92 family
VLASIYTRLLNALALYLAQPVKRHGASSTRDPKDLAAVLLPGDVLLTDGNTRMAALVRRVTRSPWSHVSMYVGPLEAGPDPRCIVEADIAAGVRAMPLSELRGLRVRVLRRSGLDDAQRRRLADWVVSRIGGQYDLAHALALARRLLRLPIASPIAPVESATRFICSTLLAQAFLLAGHPVVPDHTYVTPSDFETASALEPVTPPQ